MTTSGDMVKYQSGARTRLGIGSANQILQVKSSLPSWETVDLADTVLTTAGDVLYENATPELARLPKGTQYYNLQMGASIPAWSASSTSVLGTTGDILSASSANTLSAISPSTSGHVLTSNGATTLPSFQAVAGGGGAFTELFSQVAGTGIDVGGTADTTFDDYNFIYVSYLLQNYRASGTQDANVTIHFYDNSAEIGGTANYLSEGVEFGSTLVGLSVSSSELRIANDVNTQNFATGYFWFSVDAVETNHIYGYAQGSVRDTAGTDPSGSAISFLCNNVSTSIRGFIFTNPGEMGTNTVTYKVWGI